MHVFAMPLEIPMPLDVDLLLARVVINVLHRAPVPLVDDYRVVISAILPVVLLAEQARAHFLSGDVEPYAAEVIVPACVQPSMSLGTVPNSLSVLLGKVAVLTAGPAGLDDLAPRRSPRAAAEALLPPRTV